MNKTFFVVDATFDPRRIRRRRGGGGELLF